VLTVGNAKGRPEGRLVGEVDVGLSVGDVVLAGRAEGAWGGVGRNVGEGVGRDVGCDEGTEDGVLVGR
jgi:hypothetical protein